MSLIIDPFGIDLSELPIHNDADEQTSLSLEALDVDGSTDHVYNFQHNVRHP